jgi:DnaA family protein
VANQARRAVTQLALGLRLDGAARFGTFVPGRNAAAVRHLQSAAVEPSGELVWLRGRPGSGKSHLLQAACHSAGERGRRAMYVPCGARGVEDADVLAGLEELELLALDQVERVAADAAWERRLFAVLEARPGSRQTVLIGARGAPGAVGFALPDLASRAAAGAVYRLEPLTDEERLAALRAHARARGIALEPAAARYLLNRVGREMRELAGWIERLDDASLRAQRKLTIPFLRELLERDGS